jgi:DNA-binding beta-propeller fold protein YncE
LAAGLGVTLFSHLGCAPSDPNASPFIADLVIGQRGLDEGRFQKPRSIAIDLQDRIYVVDKSGRVQVFDTDGNFLRLWNTPAIENGKPTGLSIDSDGSVVVADTHYFRFLFYSPEGELLTTRTIGGENGPDPGQFAFVTDIVRMPNGEFITSEYGEFCRLQKYSSDGRFVSRFGEHGSEPLQFNRPQCLAVDGEGYLWVADACNHRFQILDWRGERPELVRTFGSVGNEPGQFKYPYGFTLIPGHVLVSEFGNHRVQKLDRQGRSVSSWGRVGRQPGELMEPWAVSTDSRSRIYVVDYGNNRVQRFRL